VTQPRQTTSPRGRHQTDVHSSDLVFVYVYVKYILGKGVTLHSSNYASPAFLVAKGGGKFVSLFLFFLPFFYITGN
jgi:hypothetical protein